MDVINLDAMTNDELTNFILKTPKGNKLRSYAINMQRAISAIENGYPKEAKYFFDVCDSIYQMIDPTLRWK